MVSWQRNLVSVWVAQFLSLMGFAFAFPFVPFYLRELGVTDETELAWWIAGFAATAPVSLAIASPFWGWAADRFGKRLMLLRANVAATFIISAMGLVHDPAWLLVLRVLQGMFTGTVTAAQAMVAAATPDGKSGTALGSLSSAVFGGVTVGAALGAVVAHNFGYRMAFFVAGGLFFLATLFILVGTREPPAPPAPADGAPEEPVPWGLAVPVLLLFVAVAFARNFEMPYFPVLVEEITGDPASATLWVGALAATGGMAGLLAGFIIGRWADYTRPLILATGCCVVAAVALYAQAGATRLGWLFPLRFASLFAAGGLDPVLQTWLSRLTPPRRRGQLFGWGGSARATGWMLCALVAGAVVARYGVRAAYHTSAGLYVALLLVMVLLTRKLHASSR